MDTSRIEINITDNSTSLIENPTAITGFTVVKAPKGPVTPIRVNSGAAAAMKDIFGVSSHDYPELFEAETFNREYDLWISAPYTSAKVPVAYVTNNGVFRGADLVDYDESLEKIINGESDPDFDNIEIEGFNKFKNKKVNALLDIRYALSQKVLDDYKDVVKAEADPTDSDPNHTKDVLYYRAHDLGPSYVPGWVADYVPKSDATKKYDAVTINLGIPKEILIKTVEVTGSSLMLSTIGISGLSGKRLVEFSLSYNENADCIQVFDAATGGNLVGEIPFITPEDTSDIMYKDLIMYLFGNDAEGSKLTTDYIKNNLDQVAERKTLGIFFEKEVDSSNIYGVILPKYPSARTLSIDFSAFSETQGYSRKSQVARNILKMDVYEEGAFHNAGHKIHIEGSLNNEARDANGGKIGFVQENATYSMQNLVFVYPLKTFTSADIVNKDVLKYPSISLFGGERHFKDYYVAELDVDEDDKKVFKPDVDYYEYSETTSEYTETVDETPAENKTYYVYEERALELHNLGWELAKDGDYSDVDVFFDSELHPVDVQPGVIGKSVFFTLATTDKNNHELAGYYFNHTLSPAVVELNSANYQLTFGRNYWNVDNHAVIMLNESGTKILSPLTGAMALMECRILEHRYGGLAPMWENSGNPSMGGQLRSIVGIYKLRYRYTKTQLDILDDLNYNPVINDRQDGFMVVGQKTCQAGESTDWSYIGHAASFLNFIKEIRANVMKPQIGKANNPYYRTLRKEQVERYLAKRLEGNNRIWAWAEVDTSTKDGVNDVYARKAKKFIINVRVMVDTFSEKVVLNFTNEDQSTLVSIS